MAGASLLAPTFPRSRMCRHASRRTASPLTVTVHIGPARDSLGSPPIGSAPIRYRVTAQPPNGAAIPLCERTAEDDCLLHLDGSAPQRGVWVFTLTASGDSGVISETRARMRVT